MENPEQIRNALIAIDHTLLALLGRLKTLPHLAETALDAWESTCRSVEQQLGEETIRVAVVGAIKSGKSTLVNALFKGDYLKRGAGVITSIVTRIRAGKRLQATLHFKTWDEINTDARQALILFPKDARFSDREAVDLRQRETRSALAKAMEALDGEQLITAETRNIHSVILSSYLQGYDRVFDRISSAASILKFSESEFEKHRMFVGDESLAVYLKDVSLEILTDRFESHIEIADCQGSDSPNPLHLAMIQDYLASTHLIIYVVSSRTGIRQADIKFLTMIHKMGILDNALFVVNSDFNEHDSVGNLTEVAEKIRNDIAVFHPNPPLFVFSALFRLFMASRLPLSEKERLRKELWEREEALATFSDGQCRKFEAALFELIHERRFRLLMKEQVERLWGVASGIFQFLRILEKGLSEDTATVHRIMKELEEYHRRVRQIQSMIQTTLDGAVSRIKQELKSAVDRFFDLQKSGIAGQVLNFIQNHEPVYDAYGNLMEKSGFSRVLYQVFSDFKQSLDAFITESITPEVIHFLKDAESRMGLHFAEMASPYEAMVRDALEEYRRTLAALDIPSSPEPLPGPLNMDMTFIREISGIQLPKNEIALRYSARIRSDAMLHFGIFSVSRWIDRLLKKPIPDETAQSIRALRKGVWRMKREVEQSIRLHFKDYQENIKFQYLFKLVEAASRHLRDTLMQRLQDYTVTLNLLERTVDGQQEERSRALETILSSRAQAQGVREEILRIRETIQGITE